MKGFLLTLLRRAVLTAKLGGPGGVRAVIAENLVLKQQLIVLRRGRRRAPSLKPSDRLLCGFGASSSAPDAFERSPSPSVPQHSWRFIRPWYVANTAGCSRQRRARRSPDRKG